VPVLRTGQTLFLSFSCAEFYILAEHRAPTLIAAGN